MGCPSERRSRFISCPKRYRSTDFYVPLRRAHIVFPTPIRRDSSRLRSAEMKSEDSPLSYGTRNP
jgi:hypothetical protein